jgi:hypothetical protein
MRLLGSKPTEAQVNLIPTACGKSVISERLVEPADPKKVELTISARDAMRPTKWPVILELR